MVSVLTNVLNNTPFTSSLLLPSIGFALIAAAAGLLRVFLRRPKKADLPVFRVQDDVVKALEEAHEAVRTKILEDASFYVHNCSVPIPRSSFQWLVKK